MLAPTRSPVRRLRGSGVQATPEGPSPRILQVPPPAGEEGVSRLPCHGGRRKAHWARASTCALHDLVLGLGALPLDALAARVDVWIAKGGPGGGFGSSRVIWGKKAQVLESNRQQLALERRGCG